MQKKTQWLSAKAHHGISYYARGEMVSTKITQRTLAKSIARFYIFFMAPKNGSVLVGYLTTVGRKTGEPRSVELRLVYVNGNFYATTERVGTKHWCRNMIENPAVEVLACGERYTCVARQVSDEKVRRRILTLRDSPALMERVVFEIAPRG